MRGEEGGGGHTRVGARGVRLPLGAMDAAGCGSGGGDIATAAHSCREMAGCPRVHLLYLLLAVFNVWGPGSELCCGYQEQLAVV